MPVTASIVFPKAPFPPILIQASSKKDKFPGAIMSCKVHPVLKPLARPDRFNYCVSTLTLNLDVAQIHNAANGFLTTPEHRVDRL